ncbi:MAG: aminodeoxychorismate/anthranilate synthase component II [Kiritimatiellaeota bacterium]|nr:aminodeoxychorismate/anthranilate synthase component II [Kiritimatiellota bacterium]
MILVIDNYDSFTYNLVQYLGELGAEVQVFRNDAITLEQIAALKPGKILVSPGPCDPPQAGISCEVIWKFGPTIPTFGVCLGHQCSGHVFGGKVVRAARLMHGHVFGGKVVRAARLMHGKTSQIRHDGRGVFAGMPNPFEATRYHSLLVQREGLPADLEISADTDQGEIMGLRHKIFPIHGVQFHPESILTQDGKRILKNFLAL